jgi:hypothetical protein
MMKERIGGLLLSTALLTVSMWVPGVAGTAADSLGQEPVRQGGWIRERDEQTGVLVQTMEMTLHPRGEPRPALQHRLLPDEFDMVEGNAAVHYLKAMGFLEQAPARDQLRELYRSAAEQAAREGRGADKLPPYSWLEMAPRELPVDEVRDLLRLTAFQPPMLAEATRRRRFDMDRNIREANDVIGYLIPEMQGMRELARMQSLRCKVAIAENRVGDAFAILGQQFALGRHLGQDGFLISSLVGVACTGVAWSDALYLVQHPDAPNLYWAFAALPRPLVDMRYALDLERQFLYLQVKALREVDETLRPPGYWQDFLENVMFQLGEFTSKFGTAFALTGAEADREAARTMLVGFVAAAYPGAKRYLIEERRLPREQVEAYPTAQVVFLAMVRHYDEARDEFFKWTHLPYHQARHKADAAHQVIDHRAGRLGWSAAPAQMLLPAIGAVLTASARLDQNLALVQTVEAIRMYGADHDGRLPESLADLPVPAPPEPFTGEPLDYQYHGDHAVLTGHEMNGLQYRLVLRFAAKQD